MLTMYRVDTTVLFEEESPKCIAKYPNIKKHQNTLSMLGDQLDLCAMLHGSGQSLLSCFATISISIKTSSLIEFFGQLTHN